MSPCFNNPRDLAALYEDLPRLELHCPASGDRVDLTLIVVDNASDPPMESVAPHEGVDIEILRLQDNTGGSGGYNAGMAAAIRGGSRGERPEFVWLIDSDACPRPDALVGLIETIDANPEYAVLGSALEHPETGEIFEIGGTIDSILCQFGPKHGPDNPAPAEVVTTRYTAACSALARTEAIERAGLFPDVFLNADDVEWCVRLARVTGMRVGATSNSVVRHPQMKPGPTIARYFQARNCFGPVDAMRFGARGRFIRALRETPRAMAQCMVGRRDLAELVLRGMRDAAANRLEGRGALAELEFEPFVPFEKLREQIKSHRMSFGPSPTCWVHPKVVIPNEHAEALEHLLADAGAPGARVQRGLYPLEKEAFHDGLILAAWRWLAGPSHDIAVIPVRGRPNAWARGRVEIQVTPDRAVIRTLDRRSRLASAIGVAARGIALAWKLARRKPATELRDRMQDALSYDVPKPVPHPMSTKPSSEIEPKPAIHAPSSGAA